MTADEETMIAHATERLLPQEFRRPRMVAILTSWVRQAGLASDALREIGEVVLDPDASIGVGLDRIGAILHLGRNGRTDAAYRVALRARGRAYRSQGRISDLREMLEIGVPAPIVWHLDEYPPAALVIWAVGLSIDDLSGVVENVRIARGNAIETHLTLGVGPSVFTWTTGPGWSWAGSGGGVWAAGFSV